MQQFPTRVDMLSMVPKGGRVAEIGVFAGDFSQQLLDVCRPRELVLVDIWGPGEVTSGDVDGNNVRAVTGDDLERQVRARFRDRSEVKVVKGTSIALDSMRLDGFDAIYVDADHSYEGVRRDLLAAWRGLRHGGLLMGHDYEINPSKAGNSWQFGVREAVDDFCADYRQRIVALTQDGCASFAIQIAKDPPAGGLACDIRSAASLWRHRTRRVLRKCFAR